MYVVAPYLENFIVSQVHWNRLCFVSLLSASFLWKLIHFKSSFTSEDFSDTFGHISFSRGDP